MTSSNRRCHEPYSVKQETLSAFCSKLLYECGSGNGALLCLQLYPGVQLLAVDFHMGAMDTSPPAPYRLLKLNYCFEGRCEIPLPENRYAYMRPGLLSVDTNAPRDWMRLPSKEYVGLELVVDLEVLQTASAWTEWGIDFIAVAEALSHTDGSYLAQTTAQWAHLAKELYDHIFAQARSLEDYRFLTLQLLWLLKSGVHCQAVSSSLFLTIGQRALAMNTEALLTADLRKRYVIEDLARGAGVSPSTLKKYFTQMYGKPISTYLKEVRVERARELLVTGQQSIGDIADAVGYENQGKFGAMFRQETGVTPLEYRRRHRFDGKRGENSHEETIGSPQR